jgi:hypothetical protein
VNTSNVEEQCIGKPFQLVERPGVDRGLSVISVDVVPFNDDPLGKPWHGCLRAFTEEDVTDCLDASEADLKLNIPTVKHPLVSREFGKWGRFFFWPLS